MKTFPAIDPPAVPPRQRVQNELPSEPPAPGAPTVITAARNVAGLLEREPGLWPGLTACVTDTFGQLIVHYAAGRGTESAEALFGPDGVVARWRSMLTEDQEARQERNEGREHVITVRGKHSGHSVTVLFTVIGGR